MKKVETQIHPAQLEKIRQSGKSVYQFLQEAIDQKLKKDKEQKSKSELLEIVDYKLAVFEKTIEEKLFQIFEATLNEKSEIAKMVKEQIDKDEQKKNSLRNILEGIENELQSLKGGMKK